MKICILPILFIQILLCISCGSERNEIVFSESESLLDTDPDSALSVLNSILYPEELNTKDYNRYVLLKIQAKYKSYQDITSDSTIFSVKEYYLKKKDIHNIALSSYYCGCYYSECNNKEKALRNYHFALDYAEKDSNSKLKGLIHSAIGSLLLNQLDIEDAMCYFRKSTEFYQQTNDIKNEANSYIQIGDCYQYLEKPDSALHYYMKCLNLIDNKNLHKEEFCVRQNIGVLYSRNGEYLKAVNFLKEALLYESNQENRIKTYNVLAEVYAQSGQLDSAYVYINQSLQRKDLIQDLSVKASLYEILSSIQEKQGSYYQALESHKNYLDNIVLVFTNDIDKNLLNLQKKYDYEKIRLQNVQLKLNRTYLILNIVIALLIIFIVMFIFYGKYKLAKKKITEFEDKFQQLKNMTESFNEKEKTFRSYLLRHFNILKKTASLEIYVKKGTPVKSDFWTKKFNEILYGQESLDWEVLYKVINELHNDFFIKLRKMYPHLDETEFRIICLTYTKFTSDEIAIILNHSVNTINAKRSAIRKRIGVESFGNLNDFLNERLNV